MTFQTSFVPGTPRLAYDHSGEGPPVVFIHGIGGNKSNWHRQMEALAERFSVHAWDARGYHESDDYEGPLAFEDFSHDLYRFLDHLGVEKAHLLGLSMGARVLMDFHHFYSSRIATLTLCDCFSSFGNTLSAEERAGFLRLRQEPLLAGKSFEDLAPDLVDSLLGPHATPEVRQELMRSIHLLHKGSYLKTLEATQLFDRTAELKKMTMPVLLIYGGEDRLTPPKFGEKMVCDIPDASMEVIEGAGHLSNLEEPGKFNRLIDAFFTKHASLASFR